MVEGDKLQKQIIKQQAQSLAFSDSALKAMQVAFQIQSRQLTNTNQLIASKDNIISAYAESEKDLRKQLKRQKAKTTLTGMSAIAIGVLAVILFK